MCALERKIKGCSPKGLQPDFLFQNTDRSYCSNIYQCSLFMKIFYDYINYTNIYY
jgi:hypothetical protein